MNFNKSIETRSKTGLSTKQLSYSLFDESMFYFAQYIQLIRKIKKNYNF